MGDGTGSLGTPEKDYVNAISRLLFGDVLPLLAERHAQYGAGNLLEDGHEGISIRMKDKCARIRQLAQGEDTTAALKDAYEDIIGYALNGLLLLKGGVV